MMNTIFYENPFREFNSLTSIVLPKNFREEWKIMMKDLNYVSLREVEIPGSILDIPYGLFSNCSSLKKITMHNGLKAIRSEAFAECISLEKISIPKSVCVIDKDVFRNCISLKKLEVDPNNRKYCDMDGALFDKSKTTLIRFPSNKQVDYYQIPNSVKIIDDLAFQNCSFITLPTNLIRISSYCFVDWASLKKVKLNHCTDLTTLEEKCF